MRFGQPAAVHGQGFKRQGGQRAIGRDQQAPVAGQLCAQGRKQVADQHAANGLRVGHGLRIGRGRGALLADDKALRPGLPDGLARFQRITREAAEGVHRVGQAGQRGQLQRLAQAARIHGKGHHAVVRDQVADEQGISRQPARGIGQRGLRRGGQAGVARVALAQLGGGVGIGAHGAVALGLQRLAAVGLGRAVQLAVDLRQAGLVAVHLLLRLGRQYAGSVGVLQGGAFQQGAGLGQLGQRKGGLALPRAQGRQRLQAVAIDIALKQGAAAFHAQAVLGAQLLHAGLKGFEPGLHGAEFVGGQRGFHAVEQHEQGVRVLLAQHAAHTVVGLGEGGQGFIGPAGQQQGTPHALARAQGERVQLARQAQARGQRRLRDGQGRLGILGGQQHAGVHVHGVQRLRVVFAAQRQ